MNRKASDDSYSEQEAARRLEALVRGAFSGPPKSYEESKLGKPRGKPGKSPKRRKGQSRKI